MSEVAGHVLTLVIPGRPAGAAGAAGNAGRDPGARGDASLLKPGNHVFLSATRQPGGGLTASRVTVGKDGLVPPM